MVTKFLKIAGVKTPEEFYKKYPNEQDFFDEHPDALPRAQVGKNFSMPSDATRVNINKPIMDKDKADEIRNATLYNEYKKKQDFWKEHPGHSDEQKKDIQNMIDNPWMANPAGNIASWATRLEGMNPGDVADTYGNMGERVKWAAGVGQDAMLNEIAGKAIPMVVKGVAKGAKKVAGKIVDAINPKIVKAIPGKGEYGSIKDASFNKNSNLSFRDPETGQIVYSTDAADFQGLNTPEMYDEALGYVNKQKQEFYNKTIPSRGGYSEIPEFNKEVDKLRLSAEAGNRPLLGKDNFYNQADIDRMIKQQQDYNHAVNEYEKLNPQSGADMMMNIFGGKDPYMETFNNLHPNIKQPNWGEKFYSNLTDVRQLREHIPYAQGIQTPLNPNILKYIGSNENKLSPNAKNLIPGNYSNWHLTNPRDYVMEMGQREYNGSKGIKAMSDEEVKVAANKIAAKLKQQQVNRYLKDVSTPFTGKDAYKTLTPNKYGGENDDFYTTHEDAQRLRDSTPINFTNSPYYQVGGVINPEDYIYNYGGDNQYDIGGETGETTLIDPSNKLPDYSAGAFGSFDPTKGNIHNLQPGEKPLSDSQLKELRLSRWNPDTSHAYQEGERGWYKVNYPQAVVPPKKVHPAVPMPVVQQPHENFFERLGDRLTQPKRHYNISNQGVAQIRTGRVAAYGGDSNGPLGYFEEGGIQNSNMQPYFEVGGSPMNYGAFPIIMADGGEHNMIIKDLMKKQFGGGDDKFPTTPATSIDQHNNNNNNFFMKYIQGQVGKHLANELQQEVMNQPQMQVPYEQSRYGGLPKHQVNGIVGVQDNGPWETGQGQFSQPFDNSNYRGDAITTPQQNPYPGMNTAGYMNPNFVNKNPTISQNFPGNTSKSISGLGANPTTNQYQFPTENFNINKLQQQKSKDDISKNPIYGNPITMNPNIGGKDTSKPFSLDKPYNPYDNSLKPFDVTKGKQPFESKQRPQDVTKPFDKDADRGNRFRKAMGLEDNFEDEAAKTSKQSWLNQHGKELGDKILNTEYKLSNFIENQNRSKEERKNQWRYSGDSTFAAMPEQSSSRGDYGKLAGQGEGMFRVDQDVPVQYRGFNMGNIGSNEYNVKYGGAPIYQDGGSMDEDDSDGSYNEGDEVYMTDDEIQNYMKAGGEIEFLD